MKRKGNSKVSKASQKEGVLVVFGALVVSLLKFLAGAMATSFLNGVIEAGGSFEYYFPVIAAHILIYAAIDVIFLFILKSRNIKYGVKTYVALAVVPVAVFLSQLIFLGLSSASNKPSAEPMIIWLVVSLGLVFLTAAIGHFVKLLPKKSK